MTVGGRIACSVRQVSKRHEYRCINRTPYYSLYLGLPLGGDKFQLRFVDKFAFM